MLMLNLLNLLSNAEYTVEPWASLLLQELIHQPGRSHTTCNLYTEQMHAAKHNLGAEVAPEVVQNLSVTLLKPIYELQLARSTQVIQTLTLLLL